MNILMFNYEYPPLGGGGGVVHQPLAETLAERHRVVVITSHFGKLPRVETQRGVEIHRVRVVGRHSAEVASILSMLSYPPAAWIRAARVMARVRFDVINSHFAIPTGPGSLLPARLKKVPHVLSLHGGDIYDPSKRLSPHGSPLLRWVVDAVLDRSAAVVAQSGNTRDNVRRFYRYRGPIEVIPLGIRAPAPYPPAPRAELGLPDDVYLAVTVGRLIPRKRLQHLLEALAGPEAAAMHLAIVGDGPELPGLKALGAKLGVNERVHFLGRVSDERKWQVLAASDVYASATMHEGFGLVYLEAMLAGLPVVTYDEGGQNDFLVDGETGYLVPAGRLEGLRAALGRALAERSRLRAMGAANRDRAARFDIRRCAAAYEEVFERVRC